MEDPTSARAHEGSALNRRTIIKGAAWSLPVIAMAVAAPAASASGSPTGPAVVTFLNTPYNTAPGSDYAHASGVLQYNASGLTHADITRVEFTFDGADAANWNFSTGSATVYPRVLTVGDPLFNDHFYAINAGSSGFKDIYPRRDGALGSPGSVTLVVTFFTGSYTPIAGIVQVSPTVTYTP